MAATSIVLASLCAVWFLQAALVFKHLSELRTLAELDPPEPALWPRVSAVIPSRDEADELPLALASRLADGYPDLELVVVDDRSTDSTPEVLARLAETDSRVKPVRVDALPERWLGKVHALATGVQAATGEWFLVSDADIHFEPGALKRAVAVCEDEGLDFLALVPEFRSRNRFVDVFWAVFIRVFSLACSPKAVRDPSSKTAAGSGSFMLVRKSAYDRSPGFEWLRMETADDMAFGMMMKRSGARCDFMNGYGSARVSIYDSPGEFFRGVEKNGASLARAPFAATAGLMALAGAVELSPLAAFAVGVLADTPWLAGVGALSWAAATAATVAALKRNTGMVAPALLWPVGWVFMAAGILRSAWLTERRGGVVWRGTFYPLAELLEGQRYRLM